MADDNLDKLRLNSRIKHFILEDYLPVWASILGSRNKRLNYFDCYAGPGKYIWDEEEVDGSPIIAIKGFIDLLKSNHRRKPEKINLLFIENNPEQINKLNEEIACIGTIPNELNIEVSKFDSEYLIEYLLKEAKRLAPSFFFIDPYEHPFNLMLMNRIMEQDKTEIMVNFMYYQIIRDIPNYMKKDRCLKLFQPDDPTDLDLITANRYDETKILEYLHKRIEAKYYIPFKVNYGPDEGVSSNRLKYLLIHYSNHFKAFNLMLNLMWKHSDEGRPLMVSDRQPVLFPLKNIDELNELILDKYNKKDTIPFNELVEENWRWYFRVKQYREVMKKLEKEDIIRVTRVTSRTRRGLSENDVIVFI